MDSFCQAVCFGISSACAELNVCGLKQLALKQTCLPFLQLAPAAASFFFRPSPSRLLPGRNTVFVSVTNCAASCIVPSLGYRKRAWTFLPVRRLLGSRQVATQCLCQLNELCSILHRSLFRVSKESMDLYAVQIVPVRWRNTKQNKTNRNHKKPQPSKNKTKHQTANRKNHIIAADKSALCELQQLMCLRLSLACIEATPQTEKTQMQGARKGCKKSSSRCGNPESPQQDPGDHNATPTQQAPQSQDDYALHEGVLDQKRAWTYTQSKLSLCDGDTRSKIKQNKEKPQKAQTKQKQNKAPNRKQKNHIIAAGHRLQPSGTLTS